jgi:hypothetical protein
MAANAHEVPKQQLLAMGLLSAFCVIGGLFGAVLVAFIGPVLTQIIGTELPGIGSAPSLGALMPFSSGKVFYDAPTITLFVIISATLTTLLVHRISNRRTRRAPPWDCGFPNASPRTQYTASSFSQPLRRIYASSMMSAREDISMPSPGDSQAARFHLTLRDHIWEKGYLAPTRCVQHIARRLDGLQMLSIRRYLVLMFAALVALLIVTAVWI